MLVPATEASPILTMGSSWPSSISSIIAAILAADAYGLQNTKNRDSDQKPINASAERRRIHSRNQVSVALGRAYASAARSQEEGRGWRTVRVESLIICSRFFLASPASFWYTAYRALAWMTVKTDSVRWVGDCEGTASVSTPSPSRSSRPWPSSPRCPSAAPPATFNTGVHQPPFRRHASTSTPHSIYLVAGACLEGLYISHYPYA